MTLERYAEIKARLLKATPGPWSRVKTLGARHWTLGRITSHRAEPLESDADWELTEHAYEDIRDLLAEVERLGCVERAGPE